MGVGGCEGGGERGGGEGGREGGEGGGGEGGEGEKRLMRDRKKIARTDDKIDKCSPGQQTIQPSNHMQIYCP